MGWGGSRCIRTWILCLVMLNQSAQGRAGQGMAGLGWSGVEWSGAELLSTTPIF